MLTTRREEEAAPDRREAIQTRKVVVEQNADISLNRSNAKLCSQYVLTKGDLRCQKVTTLWTFSEAPLASYSPQDLWTLSLREVFYLLN